MRLGDPKTVGEMMRERRKRLGFTIEQMAEAVGLSPITIMRLELGRVGYIHAKTAKALEVPKKITHRMVSVPVAEMQDGTTRPIVSKEALPPDMQAALVSGDAAAAVQAPLGAPTRSLMPPKKRRANKIVNPKAKAVDLAGVGKSSVRRRFLLWLGHECTRLAQ